MVPKESKHLREHFTDFTDRQNNEIVNVGAAPCLVQRLLTNALA